MSITQSAEQALLQVEAVALSFHQTKPVVTMATLVCHQEEIVCLVGRSGSGKTTLLRAIAGLIQPTQGAIRIDGQLVRGPHGSASLVFQQYSVFPWLTVHENVFFAARPTLSDRRWPSPESLLVALELSAHQDKYPSQLSGGMQQRVALARAVAARPKVLLLDEPFGALDSVTREIARHLLLDLVRQVKLSVVFVTHDIDEAVLLGDRIYLLVGAPSSTTAAIPVPRLGAGANAHEFDQEQRNTAEFILSALWSDQASVARETI